MKKIFLTLCLLTLSAIAGIFEESFKIYNRDADTIYMNALSAINSSDKFEAIETQTKNGYILLLYGSKYYLLTVTKRYQNQTEVKVMPQNSDYSQGSTVASEIFKLIDTKLLTQPMEQIK